MWAAALCAAGAVWLVGGRGKEAGRVHAVLAAGVPVQAGGWSWRRVLAAGRGRVPHEWWCLAAGLLVAFLGASVLPLVAGAAAVPLAGRVRRARDARGERERRGAAVIALCGALAGEVRAGRQPGDALRLSLGEAASCGISDEARSAALAAARFGGEVPDALREAAREPGAEGLLGLAACWRVAVDRGAGLAAGLERLEAALRSERDQRAELRAQLAGARSTAVMLAGLPVLGLLMGSALGAEPLRVLLHTGAGLGCLATGGVLEGAGMWWALRIVRGAEGR